MAAVVEGLTRRRQHKIHRSLSDSKYGTNIEISHLNRHQIHRDKQPKSNSTTNCVVAGYNSVIPGPSTTSDHFQSNRDSSWATSRLSLVGSLYFIFTKIDFSFLE